VDWRADWSTGDEGRGWDAEPATALTEGAPTPPPAAARLRSGPTLQTSVGPRHNLPAQLTPCIGREQDVDALARLLAVTRLLTLTGAPGVGKTRLALEVAGGLGDAFPDGVWLVELAPLADPDLVPQAVATTLGVREQPHRSVLETLAAAGRARRLLLVLDNCEHLVDACAGLADRLLQACPSLVILATSREPLGVAGETAWRVPSLALPEVDGPGPSGPVEGSALGECAAVKLFVERARAARPTFALTDLYAQPVARICRRLDGIPLAIELAAARVTALSVEQIADRLDDRFRMLTGGNRTALPHQRTLRAAVDWSYDLLSEPERALLRRLAVFAGGWSLEAAEAICAGDEIESSEILDLLQRLVDRSLVVAEAHANGSNRYAMLEMLQHYALDRLAEGGEEEDARRQHAAYFLALAEQAEPELRGPREREWSACLDRENENLRAALRWCIDRTEAEQALRLGSALWRFWFQRGYLVEGLAWLEQALALAPASGDASDALLGARARALNGAGNLASVRGEHVREAAFLEESLALRRRLGDTAGEAIALLNLGTAARSLGDSATASARYNESLELFRSLGDTVNTATSLFNLGRLRHDEGDQERAAALYGESLALFQTVGSERGVAIVMSRLGDLARNRGDLAAAERLHGNAHSLLRGRDDPWVLGQILTGLARTALAQRDHVRSAALAIQGLGVLKGIGADRDTAITLVVLACAACATGRAVTGARLLGAVARAFPDGSAIGAEQAGFEQVLTTTRAALGEGTFASAWAEGQRLTLDEAVEIGLALAAAVPPMGSAVAEPATGPPVDALTRRERDVAALIARGLTNREIAEALVISEMTADSHVSHILRKLGFRSRVQVARWAVERGMRSSGDD
jgi:predicted ATPase/DNA-binding CsgD family transcriptional regulator